MVIMHVKRGDESQFLFSTSVTCTTDETINSICHIYNGMLKISRICYEMEELAKYGTMFPPEILGLTEEQVDELKLKDEWGETCVPSGGWSYNKDPIGRRNGKQPNDKMQELVQRTIQEARAVVSKKKVTVNEFVTLKDIHQSLDLLKGVMMIVYPMGLPPHDPIRKELENSEDLTGTQASKEVIDTALAQLWFSGKEMIRGKQLKDFVGTNEKTKVIVKLSSTGQGAPAREPLFTEEERKQLMLNQYRREQELKV